MRNVIIQIRNAEQELKDAALPREVASDGGLGESVQRDVRVGKEPVERGAIDHFAAVASLKGMVGARERLIEKMIEAEAFGREHRRDCFVTTIHAAASGGSRRHKTPSGVAQIEGRGRKENNTRKCGRQRSRS
jgi:hypothetical protein